MINKNYCAYPVTERISVPVNLFFLFFFVFCFVVVVVVVVFSSSFFFLLFFSFSFSSFTTNMFRQVLYKIASNGLAVTIHTICTL